MIKFTCVFWGKIWQLMTVIIFVSFGVILLELTTGKGAVTGNSGDVSDELLTIWVLLSYLSLYLFRS